MHFVLLTSIIFVHAILNYLWLFLDTTPLIYDAHKFYLASVKSYYLLQYNPWQALTSVINLHPQHPLLIGIITAPMYALFGYHQDTAVFIQAALFSTILLWVTYAIGAKLYSKQTGLLAAFLVSIYPGIFGQFRVFMLDLPLTALVTLNFYTLLRSDYFTHKRWTVLWGLTLAGGILIKSNMIGFISIPTCWAFYHLWKKKGNLSIPLACGTIALLISLVYYIPHYDTLEKYLIQPRIWFTFFHIPLLTKTKILLRSLYAYIKLLYLYQLSCVFFLAFTGAMILFLRSKIPYRKLLIASIAFPFLMLVFLRPGDHLENTWVHVRYFIPGLPFIALITAKGVLSISQKKPRHILTALLVTVGIIQYFIISFVGPWQIPLPSSHYSHPLQQNWDTAVDSVLNKLISITPTHQPKKITVTLLHDIGELWGLMQYRIATQKLPLTFYCDSFDIYYWHPLSFDRLILQADFVLTADTPHLKPSSAVFEQPALEFFRAHKAEFSPLEPIRLPSGEQLLIYKNNSTTKS